MPRNGSGVYTIPIVFVPDTTAKAADVNTDFTDVGTALTGSLPRNGEAGMTGQFQSISGTSSQPGISWGSDTGTGIYRSATGTMNFISSGSDIFDVTPNGVLQYGVPVGIGGQFRNLVVKIVSPITTTMNVTADALTLFNVNNAAVCLSGVNVSAAINVSGAGGLDVGSVAASTWYYLWVIWNPATATATALFSLSSSSPTLPTGYTFMVRVGGNYSNSGSILYPVIQYGRHAFYSPQAGSGLTSVCPVIVSGNTGGASTLVQVAGVTVPPTAISVLANLNAQLVGSVPPLDYVWVGTAGLNSSFNLLSLQNGTSSSTSITASQTAEIFFNVNSIQYQSLLSASSATVYAYGWQDNL